MTCSIFGKCVEGCFAVEGVAGCLCSTFTIENHQINQWSLWLWLNNHKKTCVCERDKTTIKHTVHVTFKNPNTSIRNRFISQVCTNLRVNLTAYCMFSLLPIKTTKSKKISVDGLTSWWFLKKCYFISAMSIYISLPSLCPEETHEWKHKKVWLFQRGGTLRSGAVSPLSNRNQLLHRSEIHKAEKSVSSAQFASNTTVVRNKARGRRELRFW